MSHFWHQQPITNLHQRYHSEPFDFGLYPNAQLHSLSPLDSQKTKDKYAGKFTTIKLEEMVSWCEANCRGGFVWSARYGSLGFRKKEDAVLFRLFFDEETMPAPEIDNPIYPWQYRERVAQEAQAEA